MNDSKVILFPATKQPYHESNQFQDVALKWLFKEVKGTVSSRTLEWYYKTITNHFFPVLGEKDLNNIRLDEVLELLYNMSVSIPRTAKLAVMLFKRIMLYAYDEQYLYQSWPVHKIRIVKNFNKKEIKYIPQSLRKTVLELASANEILYPILVTSTFVGLRPGEVIALKWPHVNFRTGFIEILSTVTYDVDVSPDGVTNKHKIDSKTKTESGMRKNKAPKIVLQALQVWRNHCIKNDIFDPNGYVFVTTQGKQRTYAGLESLYRRFSQKHEVALNGLRITPKMPRHTCATMLMENKVNPKIVQKILGHKHIQTTLGTYSHVSDEVLEAVALKMNTIYEEISSNTYIPKI